MQNTRAAEPMGPSGGHGRFLDRGVRNVLWVCLAALLVHLVPLLLPRNMPEQELAIARAIPDSAQRIGVLGPLKAHPKATGAQLREAAELLREGAPEEGRALALEAERREPGSVETSLVMARLCHQARMERCEAEALERAVGRAPGDPRPDLLRADFQEQEGDVEGAAESVGRAYRKVPGDARVGVRYERLLGAAGRENEAAEVLRGLEPSLGKPRTGVELGVLRMRQGRDEEARELFAKVVEEAPEWAVGHYHLGMASYRLGDLRGAEEAWREADRLDMTDMRPLGALCAMQREAGRMESWLMTRMDLERRFPERTDAVRVACRADAP